jgi:quinolinate synthase
VILAHNYQIPEVQEIADFVGDSLELSRKAMEVDADVIVFAGVSFMAETAAILNPDKKVLHPDVTAGCPLADQLTIGYIRHIRERYKDTPIVLYINSTAYTKVYADYIVTSSSAIKLISKLDSDRVLFVPDKNLANYVAQQTGKEVIPIPPGSNCPVHQYLICRYYVEKAMAEHPNAKLLIHPEAPPDARRHASFVGSTSQMVRAIASLEGDEFLLGTEEGLAYRARKMYPDKKIYPLNPYAVCINMKKINLYNIRDSLERMKPVVSVDREIAETVREIMERSLEMIR